jgi:hypothetical protein
MHVSWVSFPHDSLDVITKWAPFVICNQIYGIYLYNTLVHPLHVQGGIYRTSYNSIMTEGNTGAMDSMLDVGSINSPRP